MQNEWFWLIVGDFKALIDSLELADLAYVSYFLVWAVILFYPLHKVDRADPIAGLMYVFFMLAAGAIVFFALPGLFRSFKDFNTHFGVLTGMAIIASYRWFRLDDKYKDLAEHANKNFGRVNGDGKK